MQVISRHRIVQPYRAALAIAWSVPHVIMTVMLAVHVRGDAERLVSLLDPRYLLPLLVSLIPAVYVWREGIDVLRGGMRARVHGVRTYPYQALEGWRCDPHSGILTVWERGGRKAFEMHVVHLTRRELLLRTLEEHLPARL